MRFIPALLAALALSSNVLAAPPLPATVSEVVNSMNADCKVAGGKPGASPGLVSTVDLNGDGHMDYVIDTTAFDCEGAASLFVGAGGGGSVEVFITTAGGSATKSFERGANGMRVEQGQLWLAVGGQLCGQPVAEDMPRSAMQACWRPLRWDASRRKLDFAPLSSVRPYR